jgi:hypothetical protein
MNKRCVVARSAMLMLALSVSARALTAQNASTAAATAPTTAPTADPADVASMDAIVCALYASISGPKGMKRDFARLRTLMAPEARFVPTGRAADGTHRYRSWSIDEYITAAGPGLETSGFFESEIGRTTTSFGNVWHIMSAYDSKRTLEDEKPFQRGVNSIQLLNGGTRWYIMSVMWDAERDDLSIPASLLAAPPAPSCRKSY